MKIIISSLLVLLFMGTLHAASYYVAKTGNDTTGDGSASNPWLTIQKGMNTGVGGDVVNVRAGSYGENVTSAHGGGPGTRLIIDGGGVATNFSFLFTHSNLTVQGFTLGRSNSWSVFMGAGGHFTVISNNVFDVNYLNVNSASVIKWDNPVPSYNTNAPGNTSPWGVNLSSGCLIISNTFQNLIQESGGIQMYGFTNTIYGNTFKDCDNVDIFHVYGGTNRIIGNFITNSFTLNGVGHGDWFQIAGQQGYGARGILIESNTVIGFNGDQQLCMFEGQDDVDMSDITFQNNLFIGVSSKGTMGCPNVRWYNNTFIRCSTNPITAGPVLIYTSITNATYTNYYASSGHGGRVYNNVFLFCGSASTNNNAYKFNIAGGDVVTNNSADYNFIAKNNYAAVDVDGGHNAVGTAGYDWQKWWEDHGINGGNPYLINERRKNFRPLLGSVLINAGTNLSSLFTTDFDGKTRDTFDMGAFEYVEVPPPALDCTVEPKSPRAYPVANTNFIAIVWTTNQYRLLSMVARRSYTNNPLYWSSWSSVYSNLSNPTREGIFVDTNVAPGIHYEYQLSQLITNWVCSGVTNNPAWSFQYISTGTDVPLQDNRGNLVLLVESGVASSLTSELANLTNDFIGDGYKVFRHDIASVEVTNTGWFTAVTNTRALVQTDYLTDTNSPWMLCIVGHVPIPYGSDTSPGSHADNLGAHPADWYYVDRNSSGWFDTAVNDSTATDAPQWNVPGDGKFDTNNLPNMPVMRLGRIDLNQYPQTGKTTAQLLSQYLIRNHQWRHKQFTVGERGTINFSNSAPAWAHGVVASFFGTPTNTVLTNWVVYGTNNSALWAHSDGTGGYDHDNSLNVPSGIGYTTNILKNPFYVPFIRTYGSYYGDWDTGMRSNLFLPVFLADTGYALTVEYGENHFAMDTSAMGEPIGQQMFAMAANFFPTFAARYIQPSGLNQTTERVHPYCSLQGDPTLKARIVYPPTNVVVTPSGSDNVVTWTASTDGSVLGYHVYRGTDLNALTKLTSTVTTSPYTNAGAAGGGYTYMVRAVKLEDSDNRSYYNASQGAFASAGSSGGGGSTNSVVLQGKIALTGKQVWQ